MIVSRPKLRPSQLLIAALGIIFAALGPLPVAVAQLSTVHPVAQCIEYANTPGVAQYVAHFSYFNSASSSVAYRPDGSSNYAQPLDFTSQPLSYYPGFHLDAWSFLVPFDTSETWHLGTYESTITGPGSVNGTGAQTSQSITPPCPARLVPAALQLSGPGTYLHQYLGQVQSAPGSDVDGTYSLVAVPVGAANLTVSNLTYVPADSANPAHMLNANSIYGDITVTAAAPGVTTALDVQFSDKGVPIVEGLVTVQQ